MTSLADLLDEVAPLAWAGLRDGRVDECDAAAALGQAGRLLDLIGGGPVGVGALRHARAQELAGLARRCHQLASDADLEREPESDPDEPDERGRLTEVMAAAADLVATMKPPLDSGECWAVAGAVLDPVRCLATVLRDRSTDAAAIDIGLAVGRVQRLHDADLPAARDGIRLDQARPTTAASGTRGMARIRGLVDELAYRASSAELDPADAPVFVAAGLTVAVYARAVEVALGGPGDPKALVRCDEMVAAWFDLRDGLRAVAPAGRPGGASVLAAELAHDLTAAFGPPMNPDITAHAVPRDELATTYRAIINRLPELASGITQAADRWRESPTNPAIDPDEWIPWRDHAGTLRYARVAATELPTHVCDQIALLAATAGQSSAVVAAGADRSAMMVGTQPHAHLARANVAAACEPATPLTRWRDFVSAVDERILADPSWPHLAHVLDDAQSTGWDATQLLPSLARELSTNRPALELVYRVREHFDLQPPTGDDHAASSREPQPIKAPNAIPAQKIEVYTPGP